MSKYISKSVILLILYSSCPEPTVSIKMTSNSANSHKFMLHNVSKSIAEFLFFDGEGLTKAFLLLFNKCILILSPRILPLVFSLDGSIANTATLYSFEVKYFPKESMNVLFPTPGIPVTPILIELNFSFLHFNMSFLAIT